MSDTILIVDDDPMNLEVAKRVVERESYRVFTAESARACMDILADRRVDLVLLDINMPGVSGIQVLQNIRSDPRMVNLPVIFLTGNAAEDAVGPPTSSMPLITSSSPTNPKT